MIPINKELEGQIRFLSTDNGGNALDVLAEAIEEYYKNECVTTEDKVLYRNQGAAQLAKWLKTLPANLRRGV